MRIARILCTLLLAVVSLCSIARAQAASPAACTLDPKKTIDLRNNDGWPLEFSKDAQEIGRERALESYFPGRNILRIRVEPAVKVIEVPPSALTGCSEKHYLRINSATAYQVDGKTFLWALSVTPIAAVAPDSHATGPYTWLSLFDTQGQGKFDLMQLGPPTLKLPDWAQKPPSTQQQQH